MSQDRDRDLAMAQLGAGTTDVGGQPPGQWRRPLSGIPVGVERVLYAAALDPELLQALVLDREQAMDRFAHELRPAELAMLRSISEPQLRATVAAIDTSADNVQRRTFLRTGAAAAAAVAVVQGASACTGTRPDEPDATPPEDGGGSDDAEPMDGPPPVTGIRPG